MDRTVFRLANAKFQATQHLNKSRWTPLKSLQGTKSGNPSRLLPFDYVVTYPTVTSTANMYNKRRVFCRLRGRLRKRQDVRNTVMHGDSFSIKVLITNDDPPLHCKRISLTVASNKGFREYKYLTIILRKLPYVRHSCPFQKSTKKTMM